MNPHHPWAGAQNALRQTDRWITEFGGRLAGSPACRQTAQAIHAELAHLCGQADLESFTTHPDGFTRYHHIDTFLYLGGVGLFLVNQPLAAALVFTWVMVAAELEFGLYREFYDRLFPTRVCYNVTAVIEPRGAARQQLIFSGHHDSAREMPFLNRCQKLYALRVIAPDIVITLGMLAAWIWLAVRAFTGVSPIFVLPAKIVLALGIPLVFSRYNLFGEQATPGAGDNLIASAMLLELARTFSRDEHRLEHTRLIFASFDAEESGLRGSRAWVRLHHDALAQTPTWALNFDSIYHTRELQFLTSDLNDTVPLDADLVKLCQQIAVQTGFPARRGRMKFGGGSTDAAELARAGVRATSLLAMSTRLVRDGLVYHTRHDTVEAIEPDAVQACLSIAEQLARELDCRAAAPQG